MKANYTYLWEFEVSPERQVEFERHYGREGTWAQLFHQSPDYIETLLLKDEAAPGRYVTLDRWRSKAGYLAFRSAFATQYAQLDTRFEQLTVSEHSLGAFSEFVV